MRFMLLLKGNADTEAGRMPNEGLIAAMMKFNEEMVNAGVMLAGEGLQPTAKGARVTFSGGAPQVAKGPVADGKDIVCGFWMIQVKSLDEAIEWVKRVPTTTVGAPNANGGQIEIRRLFEAEDFAEVDPSGESRAKEEELRTAIESRR